MRSKLYTPIFQHLNRRWLFGLAGVALVIFIASRIGLLLEDAQTILFPVALLCIARLPVNSKYRLSWVPLTIILACWLTAAIHVRGYFPHQLGRSTVYLARLNNDKSELKARELYRTYNEVANAYSLPLMSMVQREFTSLDEARSWLDARPTAAFLVLGEPNWLRVLLQHRVSLVEPVVVNSPVLSEGVSSSGEHALRTEAVYYGIDLEAQAAVVRSNGSDLALVITRTPDSIRLPAEPSDLARHYLGWLAKGLDKPSATNPSAETLELQRAQRDDAFSSAANIRGQWRTFAPVSLARFFRGQLALGAGLSGGRTEYGEVRCAVKHLAQAKKALQVKFDPELYSAILNNLGVSLITMNHEAATITDARRALAVASTVTEATGVPTYSARLALLNLLMLDRAGLS